MLIALILFLVIGLLPFFVREFRNGGRIILAYWFVISLHQAAAFTNVFLFGLPGATGDAESFHASAVMMAQTEDFFYSRGSALYRNILGVIYWLFGTSKLLGGQISILVFAVSCIILLKILRLLELSSYRVSVLLVFGSLPSMIIFGSVTLRESYEILFFMLAVYFGIKMYIGRGVKVYLIFMIVSALLMGLLHYGLIVYAVFLIALFMVWTPNPSSGWLRIKKRNLMIALSILVSLVGIFFASRSGVIYLSKLLALPEIGIEGVVSAYRARFPSMQGIANARATYLISTDFSSAFSSINTFFLIYIYYLFAPFPWQVSNLLDVVGSVEAISRLILICYSVKHWLNAHGLQRRLLGLMLILFFSMSLLWAVGTTNYGTAARHNVLTWWILSITGTPMLIGIFSRSWLGLRVHRCLHSLGVDRKTP